MSDDKRTYSKLKLDNGTDIHINAEDDGAMVCVNIGHGLLSAEFRLQAHDARAFAQALLDVSDAPETYEHVGLAVTADGQFVRIKGGMIVVGQ